MRLAAGWGLPVLLFLALALPPRAPGPDKAAAATEAASKHRLQTAQRDAKPNFTLNDLAGASHALSSQSGRIVLVHFFATWCEPCRDELTALSRLVAQPPHELSVLAVNVAEVPARVRRFLEAAPVNFPVLLDADRAVTRAWGVSILPTTFVLDRALAPLLFVEGDLDWTHPEVLAALEQAGRERH